MLYFIISIWLSSSSVVSILLAVFSASPGSESHEESFIDCITNKEIISSVYWVNTRIANSNGIRSFYNFLTVVMEDGPISKVIQLPYISTKNTALSEVGRSSIIRVPDLLNGTSRPVSDGAWLNIKKKKFAGALLIKWCDNDTVLVRSSRPIGVPFN